MKTLATYTASFLGTTFTALTLIFFAGCGGSEKSSGGGGIPIAELPTKQSSRSNEEILEAVKLKMPSQTYFTNQFLPADGDYEALTESRPEELRPVKVGMPWIFSDGTSPLYIAIEAGFFEAVGLDVEMVPGGPGRDHLQTLVGNQVDIAITADGLNLPVFTASRTGGYVLGIGSFLKKNPVAYLSLDSDIPQSQKSETVVTLNDFAQSTIGVIRGRTHYVEFLVHEYGLDPEQVLVRWTGTTPDALITGVVDHWAAWILDQPRMLEKNGFHNWRAFFFHDLGWKQYCDIVVIRQETAKEDPDLARRFMAAFKKAVDLYFENPPLAAEITSKYAVDVSYSPEDVLRRFEVERELVKGDDGLPLLHMDGDRWDEVTALLVKYGIIEDTPFF